MPNRVLIEKEINEYCKLNNINDIEGFITQCMLNGFNTFRYGVSPSDNIKKENGEVELSQDTVENRESRTEVKKRKIKVIHND